MKQLATLIFCIGFIMILTNCGSRDQSKTTVQNNQDQSEVKLNDILQKKVGSWIKEGSECYGLIVMTDKDGKIHAIKELKAVALIIQSDKIKMKALEDVSLAPKAGCTKLGIAKGETWWEEEGDLFQTREEAIEFKKTVKIDKKSPVGAKFTID